MRFLISLLFFNLISPSVLADSILDQSLWQNYVVKKDEWIYKIVRESALVKSGVVNEDEVVIAILKKNPEIKDPNKVIPGHKLLVPVIVLPKNQKLTDGGIVNYHIYVNSTVYNGNIAASENLYRSQSLQNLTPTQGENNNKKENKKEREPASHPEIKSPVEKIIEPKKDFEFGSTVSGGMFYRFISATQLSNLSKASRASNLNYQLDLDFKHLLYNQVKIHYIGELESESYQTSSASLFKLGIDLEYPAFNFLSLRGGLSYKQTPILNSESGTIQVDSVSHPLVSAQLNIDLFSLWNTQVVSALTYNYLLGTTQDNIEFVSGSTYQLDLGLMQKLMSQNLGLNFWFQNSDIETKATKQSSTALGTNITWQSTF
ncbi:MAG: hypothetical protein H6625_09890 [Bdellovibrionaceae bacterium]|nr:hypothetical protein [Pseudobdellovibrionaceae bacterium]